MQIRVEVPTVRGSPSSLNRCCNNGARSSRDIVVLVAGGQRVLQGGIKQRRTTLCGRRVPVVGAGAEGLVMVEILAASSGARLRDGHPVGRHRSVLQGEIDLR